MPDLANPHKWRFFRAGGFDQVLLERGDDLINLASLDQKLWVALSAPSTGVQFNTRTLQLIDTDGDGQIRVPELLAALSWTAARIKSMELLISMPSSLKMSDIDDSSEAGRMILASIREILKNLGKSDADEITLEDAIDIEKIFAGTGFNGDGVITALSTDDDNLKEWLERIRQIYGETMDRSGEPGVSAESLNDFAAAIGKWFEWRSSAETVANSFDPDGIDEVCQLWERISPKIDDFFVRCRLAAFDPRAAEALNSPESNLFLLSGKALTDATPEIAALPLSLVIPQATLDLENGLNPAWQADMGLFSRLIATPLLGETKSIPAAEWEKVKTAMTALFDWWGNKPVSAVTEIDRQLLMEWRDKDIESALTALLEKDLELSGEAEAITDVERLLHYARHLFSLLNNFVAFRDFYTKTGPGIFQCGTLYIDGRSCELCVPVANIAKHAVLATLSRLYLVYCDCIRSCGTEKMTIAAAITSGDSDQILVGRNGIFYDHNGADWNATVVRIIEHPISLRQAFWSPYKRIGKMVGEQIQKMSAARSKTVEDKALASITQTIDKKPDAKPSPATVPQQQLFDVGKFAGIFAAIGLAVGALGSALATTMTGFMKLQWWQMPLAFFGLLMVVSGPAMVIAFFKLRQRNLGPILDANGWAINARAKLNIPFGASLTALAKLPAGS
ncbi:MAG: hypothetical protein HXX17_16990, partial [Geobacteraceae bacterium]|nr:hypothetical protein [Geobacteraceae bacterium]